MNDKKQIDFFHILQIRARSNLSTDPKIFNIINNSIEHDLYKFFYSPFGKKCGYAIWANINIESYVRFLKEGNLPAYFYEWSEGDISMIFEIVIDEDYRLNVYKELIASKRAFRSICFRKNGRVRSIRVTSPSSELENAISLKKLSTV